MDSAATSMPANSGFRVKFLLCVVPLALAVLLPVCQAAPPATTKAPSVPPELRQQTYLFEIVRYLYRWQLDEDEVNGVARAKHFVFWVRRLEPRLDPGDHSEFGEILLPQLGVRVAVKKADYTIEELDTVVKSRTFKITGVTRETLLAQPPPGCVVVDVSMNQMLDYLFRTRNQHENLDPALERRLRLAVRQQAAREGLLDTNAPAGEKVVHVAPMSPVANEVWVFWEAKHMLFYFSSDIDLSNPAVWQHETLRVRIYDLDKQVVVTHEEAPGSNRFLTRNEVGRALYNCIVLGQRVTVPPLVVPESTGSQPPK